MGKRNEIDGDVVIPGSLVVMGGFQNSSVNRTVTRLATAEGTITTIEGELVVIQDGLDDRPTFTDLADYPDDVATISARAGQDSILVQFTVTPSTAPNKGVVGFILQRSTQSGDPGTWKDIAGTVDGVTQITTNVYQWSFDRTSDGYPEATGAAEPWVPLSAYRFRVKAVNGSGTASVNWVSSTVNASVYGTWLPPQLTGGAGHSAMREVKARINAPASNVYGVIRYEVQISKDGTNWYKPATGLDVFASVDNWKDGVLDTYAETSVPQWTQTVPLAGQNDVPPNPTDTAYKFRIRVVTDRTWDVASPATVHASGTKTAGAWSAEIATLATATSAYDVVKARKPDGTMNVGALQAENLFVDNLAAIVGNLAVLSGGVDDPYNYWTLSDYPGNTRPVGSFRIGNEDTYLEIEPGAVSGPIIALESGNGDYFRMDDTGISMKATTIRLDSNITAIKASAFTLSAAGDLVTGLTNPLRFAAAGDGVGYIGIGAATDLLKLESGKLTVNGAVYLGTTDADQEMYIGSSVTHRYLYLLNSSSASGLKCGGFLVSDAYAYASPGRNDAVIKGKLSIGQATNDGYQLKVRMTESSNWAGQFQGIADGYDALVYLAHSGGYGIHVNTGANAVSSRYAMQIYSQNALRLDFLNNGRMGIGRTPTNYLLEVEDSISINGWFRTNYGLYSDTAVRGVSLVLNGSTSTYGNLDTYGAGKNGWDGYALQGSFCLMSNSGTQAGFIGYSPSIWYWFCTAGNMNIGGADPAGYKLRVSGSLRVDGPCSVRGLGERVYNSITLGTGQQFLIPAGTWYVYCELIGSSAGCLQIYVSNGWRYIFKLVSANDELFNGTLVFSDGSNIRAYCSDYYMYCDYNSIN